MYMKNKKEGYYQKSGWAINLFIVTLVLIVFTTSSKADGARYIYDDLQRLSAVIDSQGNAAIYTYDGLGNLLSITRTDVAPTGVSITFFSPQQGPIGSEVTLYGAGFSPIPIDNEVRFNGVLAQVISSSSTEMVTIVPIGTTTGPISVVNLNGSANTVTPFTVSSPISIEIIPNSAVVIAGTSIQITAPVIGTTNQNVIWEYWGNGTIVGTLSESGLYTVPSDFSDTALIYIKATSLADPTKTETAAVVILPDENFGPIIGQQVSVKIDQSPIPSGPFMAPQVSVDITKLSTPLGPFAAPQVSVDITEFSTPLGPFVAPQVSVSLIPHISAINPSSVVQGGINIPIMITGTGLSEASSLTFLLDGVTDTTITSANIVWVPDGTEVTAELTISGSSPLGLRVVSITASNGTSSTGATEGNVLIVTQP